VEDEHKKETEQETDAKKGDELDDDEEWEGEVDEMLESTYKTQEGTWTRRNPWSVLELCDASRRVDPSIVGIAAGG
jgi:hypothetical protein